MNEVVMNEEKQATFVSKCQQRTDEDGRTDPDDDRGKNYEAKLIEDKFSFSLL